MKEDKEDHLEHFFKKKYAQQIPSEPWNTPDDEVWNGIEASLHEKKRRRGVWFFLPLILSTISLVIALMTYWQVKKQHSPTQTEQTHQPRTNSPKDSELFTPSIKKTTDDSPLYSVQEEQLPLPTAGIVNSPSTALFASSNYALQPRASTPKNAFNNETFGANQLFKLLKNENTDNSLQGLFQNENADRSVQDLLQVAVPPTAKRPPLDVIFTAILPVKNNGTVLKLARFNDADNPIEIKRSRSPFWVGATAQWVFWQNRTRGTIDVPLSELIVKEYSSPSIATGIAAQKSLSNHWTLNVGLSYTQRRHVSSYFLHVPYTLATEHDNGAGGLDNTFSHSLPSELGNVGTQLVLNRTPGTAVANNEIVDIDFAFQRKTALLMIPVQLSWFPKKTGYGLFFSGGINSEIALRDELSVVNAVSHHTHIHEKTVTLNAGQANNTRFQWQAIVTSGYHWHFRQNWSAALSASYQRAFTNAYQHNNFTHQIDGISIQAGIQRKF